ncbi:MAG: hypothetical protein KIC80_00715 [Brachyspira sp.]|nr:hypothetical protein [Brachyspira sp.]
MCCGYTDGKVFESASEPTALCRYGNSGNKPFCNRTLTKSKIKAEYKNTENF